MAWHTVQEAQELTGKSRRTLYRDMASGRLSWAPDGDNGRRMDTSELIRVYGELKPLAHPDSKKAAHADTGYGTSDSAMILAELKALREEVAELRQAMRLIEYKPELAQPEEHQKPAQNQVPSEKTNSWWGSLVRPFTSK
jgi:predicted DNA-binding transcriptional regulator YafY